MFNIKWKSVFLLIDFSLAPTCSTLSPIRWCQNLNHSLFGSNIVKIVFGNYWFKEAIESASKCKIIIVIVNEYNKIKYINKIQKIYLYSYISTQFYWRYWNNVEKTYFHWKKKNSLKVLKIQNINVLNFSRKKNEIQF